MAKVSVLLPTFNRPKWLKQSVESVLSQEGVSFELLILDNGSRQDTWDYLKTIDDPRVKRFREVQNQHPGGHKYLTARSSGDYLVLWTDDDLMVAGNLAEKAKILDENPHAGMTWGPFEEMDTLGNVIPDKFQGHKGNLPIFFGREFFSQLLVHNCIPMPSVMLRRDLSSPVDVDQFGVLGDWMMWLSIAYSHDAIYTPRVGGKIRVHNDSDSFKNGVVGGGFLQKYREVWEYWIGHGFKPSPKDWETMWAVYISLANGQFKQFKDSHVA